jgi:hypothetical protein
MLYGRWTDCSQGSPETASLLSDLPFEPQALIWWAGQAQMRPRWDHAHVQTRIALLRRCDAIPADGRWKATPGAGRFPALRDPATQDRGALPLH